MFFRKKEVYGDYKFDISLKKTIPSLPSFKSKEEIDVKYSLIEPYAYTHIYFDKEKKEVIYKVIEPELTVEEKEMLSTLKQGIKELINISFVSEKGEAIIKYLEKNVKILFGELGISVSEDSYLKLMYYIYRDFVGLNEIEPLMQDSYIEDIECNGVNTPLYVVHRKYRNLKTNIEYRSVERLANFIEKLAQKCGKYVSYANPLLEASLPDGSRVSATYATDVASRGPNFTIRKFFKVPWSPIKLIDIGTLSAEMLAYFWMIIEHKSNIMIIGATGSGKTTLTNTIAFFIQPEARIISIEDTKELSLMHENWLPSVTREGTGLAAGKIGEITLFDLLRESFRQRPDYLIVGEVRGKETFTLFQGAAAGHPTLSTMHANSIETLIKRLETEPINLSPTLVETLDVVCVMAQTKFEGKIVRRVKEVIEIVKVREGVGNFVINVPFKWDPVSGKFLYKPDNYMFEKISIKHGILKEDLINEFILRTKLLKSMYKNKIFHFVDVQEIINEYYRNPKAVLKRFGIR